MSSILSVAVVILCSLLILFHFKRLNNKFIKKIELLSRKVDNNSKKNAQNKINSHLEFYRIVRHIYEITKPSSICVFKYTKNRNLKTINISFLYQIKSNGSDGTIIFTGECGQVPISNIDIISKLYHSKKNIFLNILELDKSDDTILYDFLDKNNIKYMFLVNIFNYNYKNLKPIGFFALTYTENFENINVKEIEKILTEQSSKLSEHLLNIID